jgi:hypothetical protein
VPADSVVPAAQYLRMSTEHQQYSLGQSMHSNRQICAVPGFRSRARIFRPGDERTRPEQKAWAQAIVEGCRWRKPGASKPFLFTT